MKKVPERTCVITKEKLPKSELVRVVRTPELNVVVDYSGRTNGRGAYLKKDKKVFFKVPCLTLYSQIDKIKEELADVVNYCILMADACGLDLDEIVREKVKLNNRKYPVEKAFGSKEKYTELKG